MFFKSNKLRIDSLLDQRTQIVGDVVFEGGIQINGKVIGNIKGSGENTTLVIGPKAIIEGTVEAQNVIISGAVLGPVTGNVSVLIKKTGKVTGNVTYGRIQMEDGSSVQGHLNPAAPSTVEKPIAEKAPVPSVKNMRPIAASKAPNSSTDTVVPNSTLVASNTSFEQAAIH
jgi:cytoskeletal protein CcmA (bactofilin family)